MYLKPGILIFKYNRDNSFSIFIILYYKIIYSNNIS